MPGSLIDPLTYWDRFLSVQGQRLGEKLLIDSLARSVDLSTKLGIHAVVVDAVDQKAKAFYEKYLFKALLDSELHLYLPIATIAAALSKS